MRSSPKTVRAGSSGSSRPASPLSGIGSYPIPAYLNFTPGGLIYPSGATQTQHLIHLNQTSDPSSLAKRALEADDELYHLSTISASINGTPPPPHRLPSLAALADAAFSPLTGVSPPKVRQWADTMLLTYLQFPKPTLLETLKSFTPPQRPTHRPCGYVFRRGDIAWNCRTCQTDSTCVLCDACFRESNHENHDVFFHRTTPGGCCDCGDGEAWKVEGCCPEHRPMVDKEVEDDFEAVRVSSRGRREGGEAVKSLPDVFAAALGVVIGAAVNCAVRAADGGGVGSDPAQWRVRWAEEVCRIWSVAANDEDYYYVRSSSSKQQMQQEKSGSEVADAAAAEAASTSQKIWTPHDFLGKDLEGKQIEPTLPSNFRLHLRLHNDDVHTFDEVIDALHDSIPLQNEEDIPDSGNVRLVPYKEDADNMTHHVDADGQVTVRSYNSFKEAIFGYKRLKSKGLHCAVVSTPQVDMEMRARMLLGWLKDIAGAHPGVMALVTHALVDVTSGDDLLNGVSVWSEPKMIPVWAGGICEEDKTKRRLEIFRPDLSSSYLTREEGRKLHELGIGEDSFVLKTRADETFYTHTPFDLPSPKLRKSPHALWGTLPTSPIPTPPPHPLTPNSPPLSISLLIVDTDLRKQQEADKLTSSMYPHHLTGLHIISGVGLQSPPPNILSLRPLIDAASFRSPSSSLLLLLLLDPYPPKQLRASVHAFFLSLLIDPRFKCRFAAALGGVAYRPLSTLFCAGVGTESDTPLGFTVQIFTAGSLVRALENIESTKSLLESDADSVVQFTSPPGMSTYTLPISRNIIRCVHTNLLGATKEVKMVVKNTSASQDSSVRLPALTYQVGEHPLMTPLPAAPDDGFLDSRTTRHKRLPHLLRDLEYILETPQTALRLLLPNAMSIPQVPELRDGSVIDFSAAWVRLLRLAQGMDPQKRKISGGHVEYEQSRWLEAFGLSLNFAGTRDALVESPSHDDLNLVQSGTGTLMTSILREIKLWLYREGLLETGFPMPVLSQTQLGQLEASQRSTLHWSAGNGGSSVSSVALSCATGVKMTEAQLSLIEHALRSEEEEFLEKYDGSSQRGAIMGDWLRVPHSPLMGDCLSFHLPLHRSLARTIRSMCQVVISENARRGDPGWWKLPVLDEWGVDMGAIPSAESAIAAHPLTTLLRPVLRSSNCRVVWSSGPDCNSIEAQERRSRSRGVSSAIAAAKVVHSLCDHPLRCLAAAQQIERHLWARNGSASAGMAFNYGSSPLCKSFRDLDLTLVQLSASGYSIGLGARRTFGLLMSRYSMDGYLCDPVRRNGGTAASSSIAVQNNGGWVNPPRMQDPDHAVSLAEAFFATICLLVTELPPPNPSSPDDISATRRSMRRELLHALAAEPRSHSEAFSAATFNLTRRDESESFRSIFKEILSEIAREKHTSQNSRAGPPTFQLRACCSDEYDPTFFHLRRNEHQHAMDCVARLRTQKLRSEESSKIKCLPLVIPPPASHPRFGACRLILHLPAMDAAIRRALLFALTGGQWLPPSEPAAREILPSNSADELLRSSSKFGRRSFARQSSSSFRKPDGPPPFSPAVVASSGVSFLEVLQVLTLQVHTLEECAVMYSIQELDYESKQLSQSVSIQSFLSRLVAVPSSLEDCWALQCPDPLPSAGTGGRRGSILGLLIALYEHRNDHGRGGKEPGENSGGARSLVADGLKWFLRFVTAIVDGADDVLNASQSAREGVPIRNPIASHHLDPNLCDTIRGMISNLPDLWPAKVHDVSKTPEGDTTDSEKIKKARKAAQRRALEMMKKQQASFAASIAGFEDETKVDETKKLSGEEDLCIICRCDDRDGDNNGPLGFLGHVQRSRAFLLRNASEDDDLDLYQMARVVGDRGCQLRLKEEMDSPPVACLPTGSIVSLVKSKVTSEYDLRSRRVFVRHTSPQDSIITEGWASIQSSQGYIILSPLSSLCYNNTRWGATRPIIRQCGHAAHLGCVDAHCLSLHQRAAGEQPYDGRFAANIEDGEFLCPLCKQLSNVLVPKGANETKFSSSNPSNVNAENLSDFRQILLGGMHRSNVLKHLPKLSSRTHKLQKEREATQRFGDHLLQAMQITYETPPQARKHSKYHPSLRKWDYEDDNTHLMRLFRQQHIAWAGVGHGAASAEAGARYCDGVKDVVSDPWVGYDAEHPAVMELRRTMCATASLLDVLQSDIEEGDGEEEEEGVALVGHLLADIVEGKCWMRETWKGWIKEQWRILMPFLAAIPCHVARDGSLSRRYEARVTAAQMWAVKGRGYSGAAGSDEKEDSTSQKSGNSYGDGDAKPKLKKSKKHPPAPLCIREACLPNSAQSIPLASLPDNWGTMNPFEVFSKDGTLPFRPAVASAFLYIPLLSWDLNTFAGAIYSSLLLNGKELQSEHLVLATRILLVGRLVQILITPHGLGSNDDSQLSPPDWTEDELQREAHSLSQLRSHCLRILHPTKTPPTTSSPTLLLSKVSLALLPYTRTLLLLLRATSTVLRSKTSKTKPSPAELSLHSLLAGNSHLMTTRDGFQLLREFGGIFPSQLLSGTWFQTIERWVEGAMILESWKRAAWENDDDDDDTENQTIPTTKKDNEMLPPKNAASQETHESTNTGLYSPTNRVDDDSLEEEFDDDVEMTQLIEPRNRTTVDIDIQLVDNPHHHRHHHPRGIMDDESSEEDDALDDVEMADDDDDDVIDFDEALGDASVLLGLARRAGTMTTTTRSSGGEILQTSSSEESSLEMNDDTSSHEEFANVGFGRMIPYQVNLFYKEIGSGPRGMYFEFETGQNVMCDLSHFGMVHRLGATSGLIRLPYSFVELYSLVNKVKGRDTNGGLEDTDDGSSSETAICLLTGAVMKSGSARRTFSRTTRPPGACTLHARKTGSGIGVFFLVQKCTVLLIHNNKSAYSASLYVDEHGEEDPGLRRGRPLFLNSLRFWALDSLWRCHGIPREVAQIRSTSDRVIRDNWY